jgi:hypothetical protein
MKSKEEVVAKLRDRIHRARRKWFKRNEKSLLTKDELYDEFKWRLRDPQVLLREYKDIAVLLWVLGEFDRESLIGQDPLSSYDSPLKKEAEDGEAEMV